ALWNESGVKPSQSVDHALRLEASERPTAQRDVEALALDVERLGAVYAEADTVGVDVSPRDLHAFGVRVKRVDPSCVGRRESGQPPLAAAHVQDSSAFERD